MDARGPALGFLEVESIARGMLVADALLKRAPVELTLAESATPGKYLLMFRGGVAEVEESFQAGIASAGPLLLDKLLLPQAAEGLVAALRGELRGSFGESVGIVETQTVASALLAADTALKCAEVWLLALHLARGIGGKGYFTLTGALAAVQAALEGAAAAAGDGALVGTELIERPHAELLGSRSPYSAR